MTLAEHVLAPPVAGRLGLRAGAVGLLLGRDRARRPVLLRAFGPQPTRIVLIGGAWAARVIVFRCLALGARVVLRTANPRGWEGLGEAATGVADRMLVLSDARPVALLGSIDEPVLHVCDDVADDGTPVGPWQTRLTVAAQLTEPAGAALGVADLALLQRMWPQQAAYAATLLGVDQDIAGPVQALPDDTVALVGDGPNRYAWFAATAIEQRLFGPPRRA